jgi:DNA polymerase-1
VLPCGVAAHVQDFGRTRPGYEAANPDIAAFRPSTSAPLRAALAACGRVRQGNGVTVLLLDTYSLFFRAFHALPPMNTSSGEPTQALYGFSALLLKLLREEQPAGLALARDLPGATFRHTQYAAYKAGRPRPPSPLLIQLGMLDTLLDALGLPVLSAPGFEADDVLATLARRLEDEHPVLIVSGDRDLLQLVRERVHVLFVGQRGKPAKRYDPAAVEARFGIPAQRLPGYVALVGDASDNIPKVRGVGEVAASKLMARYPDIASLLAALDGFEDGRLRATLAAHAEQLRASEQLVRLREDVPLPDLPPGKLEAAAIESTRALFEAWEFRSLIPRLLQAAERASEREES